MTTENETRSRPMLTVHIEPGGRTLTLDKAGAVGAVLKRLGFYPDQALVIQGDGLLTQDRLLRLGDEITIRAVGSRG